MFPFHFYVFPMIALAITTVAVLAPYAVTLAHAIQRHRQARRNFARVAYQATVDAATIVIHRRTRGAYLATLASQQAQWPDMGTLPIGTQFLSPTQYRATLLGDTAQWVMPMNFPGNPTPATHKPRRSDTVRIRREPN